MTEALESYLPLSLMNTSRFLGLFSTPERYDIHAKTVMHLHVLRVDGGNFAIEALIRELVNNSVFYVLSRRKLEKLQNDMSLMGEYMREVQSKFKSPDLNSGEGGELLLFSFLESHLNAPKSFQKWNLRHPENTMSTDLMASTFSKPHPETTN